ncbi:MAG: hypothetical protein PVF83_19790, partial [Anaerolineales bacterium]
MPTGTSPQGLVESTPAPNTPESPTQSIEEEKVKLWIAPYLPDELTQGLVVPLELEMVENVDESDLRLDVGDEKPLTHLIYALVAPFPTVTDSVEFSDIRKIWDSGEEEIDTPILMSEEDFNLYSTYWGSPAGNGVIAM